MSFFTPPSYRALFCSRRVSPRRTADHGVQNFGYSDKIGPVYLNERDEIISPSKREDIESEVRGCAFFINLFYLPLHASSLRFLFRPTHVPRLRPPSPYRRPHARANSVRCQMRPRLGSPQAGSSSSTREASFHEGASRVWLPAAVASARAHVLPTSASARGLVGSRGRCSGPFLICPFPYICLRPLGS